MVEPTDLMVAGTNARNARGPIGLPLSDTGPKPMTTSEFEQPTVILDGSRSTDSADTPSARSNPSGIMAIKRGLQAEEAARARTIGLVFFAVCTLTTIWAPLLDGEGQFSLFSLVVYWIAGQPARYTRRVFWMYGASAVVCSTMILIYLGPFSPTALAVTLGISFFGQSTDRLGAWVVCGSAIVLYVLLFVLIITGVMPDVGIFRGDEAGLGERIFMVAMVPLVLLVTLMQARWSRDAVEVALETAVESTMQANRRAVQLEEAQAELDRIAKSGGVLGRMSGMMVERYKLGCLLGRGGSGEVYDAIDTQTSTELAVKILRANQIDDPEMVSRFRREGDIATRLVSRYVARLHQYGETPGGTLFIAMERLNGQDLASTLRLESRLAPSAAQELVEDVCKGITDAHKLGIIHRDIKPHNIFHAKEPDGSMIWKVLDFGVSKLTSNFGTITQGGVVGTPQYMSPEQARGEKVDQSTDIYGIGAVLYRVLTGQPPFPTRGPAALFSAAHHRPTRPRLVAPDLSREIEAVLGMALAAAPKDRFQSVADLSTAFSQAVARNLPDAILTSTRECDWSSSHN